MLSQAVLLQVGDQDPVAMVAKTQYFESGADYLRDLGARSGVVGQVLDSFVGLYEQTRGGSKPNIPYFAIRPIEQFFEGRLQEKAAEARAHRTERPKPVSRRAFAEGTKKQPPRQCKPARR